MPSVQMAKYVRKEKLTYMIVHAAMTGITMRSREGAIWIVAVNFRDFSGLMGRVSKLVNDSKDHLGAYNNIVLKQRK